MSQEDYQAGRDRLLLPPSEIDLEQPPSHVFSPTPLFHLSSLQKDLQAMLCFA